MKRVFSVVLTIVCLLTVIPFTSVSALTTSDGFVYDGGMTYRTIIGYTGSETDVVIPSRISDLPVITIESGAFFDNKTIKTLTIPGSVIDIEAFAFSSCTALEKVVIGKGLWKIRADAFEKCTALERVDITDLAAWCGISFENETSNPLYYAKNLYVNGELLTELVIPDGVTNIGSYAFSNCNALTSVVIPDSVTSIGNYAFSNCSALTSVVIPDSVTSIGDYAFSNCNALTSVVIPDSVTNIGSYAFYNTPVKSLILPDSVRWIGSYTFYNTAITSITIPNSVLSIGTDAFGGCAALTDVYYEGSPSNWEMLAATDPVPSLVTVHILGEENYDNKVVAMLDYTTYADGTACINGYYGTESCLLIPSEIIHRKLKVTLSQLSAKKRFYQTQT